MNPETLVIIILVCVAAGLTTIIIGEITASANEGATKEMPNETLLLDYLTSLHASRGHNNLRYHGKELFSYQTKIAQIEGMVLYIATKENQTRTTRKHINLTKEIAADLGYTITERKWSASHD